MAFRNWIFAIGMMFKLFGDDSLANAKISTSIYPPMSTRAFMATTTAASLLLKRSDSSMADVFSAQWGRTMPEIEDVFCILTGQPKSIVGLKESADGTAWEYAQTLLKYWKYTLRDDLLPYAYGKLPPAEPTI